MATQETELSIDRDNRNMLSKDVHSPGTDKKDPKKNDSDDNSLQDLQTTEGSKSDETIHALSGLYAQIIIVVAAILVFTELLHGPVPLFFFHGYVFTFLVGGGILCFMGAYIIMLTSKCPGCSNNYDTSNEKYGFSTHLMKNLLFSDVSIYLRIGSVVFGLGTLISSGLEIASIFTVPHTCMDPLNLLQPILRGLFSFFQMHFIFMNAKDMVSSFRWFRHIALMHLVATNLAVWVRMMLWEAAKDWLDAVHHRHNSSIEWDLSKFNITIHSLDSDIKSTDLSKHKPTHNVHVANARHCTWFSPEVDETEGLVSYHLCIQNSTIGAIWEKAMPYLYPFNVQYSLVAAAILYITWCNLQNNRIKMKRFTAVSVYGRPPNQEEEVNCAGSTRGLLLGLLILVAGIIVLILFFVLAQENDFNVLFLIGSLECSIFGISILASIIGLLQIRKMRSKTSREQRLSELLQRIGMLAVYIYGICNIIVGGTSINNSQHFLLLLHGAFMVIQACLQSLFIHQVSKKRLSPLNMDEKPGREVVIFLVFTNIVLWILESFTTPNQVRSMMQLKFFGQIAWPVMTRVVLPFVIFYRFHSSVALMEAWRKSYKVKQN